MAKNLKQVLSFALYPIWKDHKKRLAIKVNTNEKKNNHTSGQSFFITAADTALT